MVTPMPSRRRTTKDTPAKLAKRSASRADLLQRAKHLFFSAKLTRIPQMGVATLDDHAEGDRLPP
jgi:hypothetical protein